MDPLCTIPWREIEQQLIGIPRLQDFAFAGISLKKCMLTYGPIIANTIANFRRAEGHLCYTNKWHRNTTVHNMHLMSGNKPFVWSEPFCVE